MHQEFKQHIIDKSCSMRERIGAVLLLVDYRVTVVLPMYYLLFLNDTIIQEDILILDCYYHDV